MPTQRRRLSLKAAEFRSSSGATRFWNAGSGTPPRITEGWTFPDAADTEIYFQLKLPPDYVGDFRVAGTVIFASATSNDAVLGASLAAITPDSDAVSILADSLASETTVTVTALSPAGRPINFEIDVAALDSAAAGDLVTLRVRGVRTSGSDSATGAVHLIDLEYTYSDT